MRRKLITLSVISITLLGACGLKGDLKTPPPIWGDKPVAETPNGEPPKTSQKPE